MQVKLTDYKKKSKMYKKIHTKIFTDIYNSKKWGSVPNQAYFSGDGSMLQNCQYWFDFLVKFFNDNEISSIVDGGCGDFVVSNHLLKILNNHDLNIEYIGYECFENLVKQHNKNHPNIDIQYLDIHSQKHLMKKADCLLLKEVIQHWENKQLLEFINYIKKSKTYKYIITANKFMPDDRQDWQDCDYEKNRTGRGLNCKMEPMKGLGFVSKGLFNNKIEISVLTV